MPQKLMLHFHRCGKIPRLPEKFGGETDIIVGVKYLKYFPKEIYKLPSGLTIYKAMFRNLNGSMGVVAGPHPSISNAWDRMGQVAYSHVVMPGNMENLECPNCNSDPPPTTTSGDLATRDSPSPQINRTQQRTKRKTRPTDRKAN